MTVSPVPFEPSRFWVSSESRAEIDHIVDTDWREEKWHRPTFVCSCEQMQAKDNPFCKHTIRVAQVECEHCGFMVLANGKGIWRLKSHEKAIKATQENVS